MKKDNEEIKNERDLKCEHCPYKWSNSYCMKKKFQFLDKRCIRRLFISK